MTILNHSRCVCSPFFFKIQRFAIFAGSQPLDFEGFLLFQGHHLQEKNIFPNSWSLVHYRYISPSIWYQVVEYEAERQDDVAGSLPQSSHCCLFQYYVLIITVGAMCGDVASCLYVPVAVL